MSCRASIRRTRMLIPGRSSSYVIGSQLNPTIGFRGGNRNREEYHFYCRSSDRLPNETMARFTVRVPDGPVIPANSNVKLQVFAASIPNTLYLLKFAVVKIAWSPIATDLIGTFDNLTCSKATKLFNGYYDMTDPEQSVFFTQWYNNQLPVDLLYFDVRSGKLINRTNYYIRIDIEDERARKAFGYPTLTQRSALEQFLLSRGFPLTLLQYPETIILTPFPNFLAWTTNEPFVYDDSILSFKVAMPNPMVLIPATLYIRMSERLDYTFESEPISTDLRTNAVHSNIVAMIPCSAGFGQMLTYANDFIFTEITARQDFKEFVVQLCDEDGNEVVPELDWQMGLRLVYRAEDRLAR